jgi:myo-inositol-1(or 4)-monophosphatase
MKSDEKVLLATNGHELSPPQATTLLGEAVVETGKRVLDLQQGRFRIWNKSGNSPVSDADIAADKFLRERLMAAAPHYGWLSEESEFAPGPTASRRRWVVDPIDGTRAFIKRRADWSVAAALVEGGRPIAAALYVPVTDELFLASAGGGATKNGTPIAATESKSAALRVAGPRSLMERLTKAGLGYEEVPRIHSLALRFARVASGEIDAAIASDNSRDWDLAAADLLVHEARGALTDMKSTRRLYQHHEDRHPTLVAAGTALHPKLLRDLGKVFAQ